MGKYVCSYVCVRLVGGGGCINFRHGGHPLSPLNLGKSEKEFPTNFPLDPSSEQPVL